MIWHESQRKYCGPYISIRSGAYHTEAAGVSAPNIGIIISIIIHMLLVKCMWCVFSSSSRSIATESSLSARNIIRPSLETIVKNNGKTYTYDDAYAACVHTYDM